MASHPADEVFAERICAVTMTLAKSAVRPTHHVQPNPRARRRCRYKRQQIGVSADELAGEMGDAGLDVAQRHRHFHNRSNIAQARAALNQTGGSAFARGLALWFWRSRAACGDAVIGVDDAR